MAQMQSPKAFDVNCRAAFGPLALPHLHGFYTHIIFYKGHREIQTMPAP